MLLWYIFGVMTGLALLPLFNLLLGQARPLARSGQDRKVYEDQLRALEAEAEQGLIGKGELEAARIEISKRLLAAAEREEQAAAPASGTNRAMLAVGSAGLVVLVALGGYLALGRPELVSFGPSAPAPASPPAAAPVQPEVAAAIAELEGRLQSNPEDGDAWEQVAPLYFRAGRYEDSAQAHANAIRLLGETAERLGDYGEALTQANGGVISPAAKAVFMRANEMDPELVQGRFYLALALEQGGDMQKAAEAWGALLKDAPPEAFWRPLVERRLAAVNDRLGGTAPAPAAGPSTEDVRGAQELPPDVRDDMIEQMVTGLAARLEADAKDLDGWLMLMRSYMVLDRPEDARRAAASARENFAGDTAALARIEEAERALGVESNKTGP